MKSCRWLILLFELQNDINYEMIWNVYDRRNINKIKTRSKFQFQTKKKKIKGKLNSLQRSNNSHQVSSSPSMPSVISIQIYHQNKQQFNSYNPISLFSKNQQHEFQSITSLYRFLYHPLNHKYIQSNLTSNRTTKHRHFHTYTTAVPPRQQKYYTIDALNNISKVHCKSWGGNQNARYNNNNNKNKKNTRKAVRTIVAFGLFSKLGHVDLRLSFPLGRRHRRELTGETRIEGRNVKKRGSEKGVEICWNLCI